MSADSSQGNIGLAVRNSALSLLSLGCRLIGNMVIFIVIARLPGVGTDDFGQLTFAVALGSLAVMASQFGLVQLTIRDLAAEPERLESHSRPILSLRLVLSFLGMAATFIYVKSLDMEAQAESVCFIMVVALYVGSFSMDIQALFQSREKMHYELFGIVAENLVLLALAGLAFHLRADIIQIAWGFLIAKSTALVLNYVVCGKSLAWIVPRIDLRQWKRLAIEASPFALAGIIAAGVVQIDTILLRELHPGDSETAVGLYQAAMRLFLVPMLLPEIVLKVFLPQFSRMHGKTGDGLARDLGRVNHILLTLGVLIGLVIVFRGGDIADLFYGAQYSASGQLLAGMGITLMMRFGAAYNLYFTIRSRIWFRVWSASAALCAVVACDWALIPKYGAMGAVYASIIAHIVYWVPFLVGMHSAEKVFFLGWRYTHAAAAGFALSVFLHLTSGIGITMMMPVYAIIVSILVFLTVTEEDRSRLVPWKRVRGLAYLRRRQKV